jgi:hypothetical protein
MLEWLPLLLLLLLPRDLACAAWAQARLSSLSPGSLPPLQSPAGMLLLMCPLLSLSDGQRLAAAAAAAAM